MYIFVAYLIFEDAKLTNVDPCQAISKAFVIFIHLQFAWHVGCYGCCCCWAFVCSFIHLRLHSAYLSHWISRLNRTFEHSDDSIPIAQLLDIPFFFIIYPILRII